MKANVHQLGVTRDELDVQLAGLKEELPATQRMIERIWAKGRTLGGQLHAIREGRVVADVAFGRATDDVLMTPSTSVRWYCGMKPVTAAAFLTTIGEYSVRLDEPVTDLFPELRTPHPPTWHHVLTHSVAYATWNLPVLLPMVAVVERLVERSFRDEFLPGERAEYHNFAGWYLMGSAIERLTQRSLASVLDATIFGPCGMTSSSLFVDTKGPTSRLVASSGSGVFSGLSSSLFDHPLSRAVANPALGGYGPMRDYARFYAELLAATRSATHPLAPMAAEMCQVQRPAMHDRYLGHVCSMGLGVFTELGYYGFGIPTEYVDGAVGHDTYLGRWGFFEPTTSTAIAVCLNGFPRDHTADPRVNRGTIPLIRAMYDDL